VLAPPAVIPPPPPVQQPVPPPSGGVSQSPAAARRRQEVQRHAESSAFAVRPAGERGSDWLFPVAGGTSILAVMLLGLAAGSLRPGRRPAPAWAQTTRRRRSS
jgi:hypothetical protein